jgi:hypothetical protein
MAQSENYGHLEINGNPIGIDVLSRLVGEQPESIKLLLNELRLAGVFSETDKGVIYSRRMIKDMEKTIQGSIYGAKGGGNPALRKKKSRIQNPESIPISITKGGIKGGYIGHFDAGIIPQNLQNQDFAKSWDDWILFRIEKKKPISDRSATSQLKHLSSMGCALAIECIEQSIRNDWQGLFDVKSEKGKQIRQEPCI